MTSTTGVDDKIKTLYDLYYDNSYASNTSADVSNLRRNADNFGLLVSISAFSLNEVARLTLRSRKYNHTHLLSYFQVKSLKCTYLGFGSHHDCPPLL